MIVWGADTRPGNRMTERRWRMRAWAPALGLVLALCAQHADMGDAAAAEPAVQACRHGNGADSTRPRVGLALGGGGARGIAHIGVLRELERLQVPVDCIAGTSMGALVGALYASGMPLDEIERLVLTLDWRQMFDDSLERPERSYRRKRDDDLNIATIGVGIDRTGLRAAPGFVSGMRIQLLFQRLVQPVALVRDFDRLPIPFRAVAADLNTGAAAVLGEGDLALAMRASMSIPGVFPPTVIDDRVLIDGGVASNVPIAVVRAMGADVVIAVNVGTPLRTLDASASVLRIADQLSGLLTVGNTRNELATLTADDVLIAPELGDTVTTAAFDKGAEALAIGRAAFTPDIVASLASHALPETAYRQHVAARTQEAAAPAIEFVRLDNRTGYADAVLRNRLDIPLGQPLDTDRMERALRGLYGFQTLSVVHYELVEEDGRTGVLVHAREKSQGPNYLELGLSLSSDFEGTYTNNLRLGILRSPANRLGGEQRVLVQLGDEPGLLLEHYQPFGAAQRYFGVVRGGYETRVLNLFDAAGEKLATYEAGAWALDALAGREFGNHGAIGLGLRRATGRAEREVGDPALPETDFESGEASLNVSVDRVDSLYFPRAGYLANLRLLVSRESLGADTGFDQLDFDGYGARSFGRHTLQGGLRYHTTLSGTAPIQSLYRLGGLSRLVGFQANELTGQHYAVLFGGYLYKLADVFNRHAYVGGTLEYGNAWERRADIALDDGILNASAYLGFDSWIGPMLIGYGWRESGDGNVFLEVGRRF